MSLIEQKYYTALAHVQARKCRTGGASDGHFGRVFEAVSEIGRGLAGKPSKQIVVDCASAQADSSMPSSTVVCAAFCAYDIACNSRSAALSLLC